MELQRNWHTQIEVHPVTSADERTKALIVRALSFFDGDKIDLDALVDGNDFQSTLFCAHLQGKIIGSARVRWFRDFAKFERSCLLPKYRNPRAILEIASQVFDHISAKGFDKVLTSAKPGYARLWCKVLGFRPVESKPTFHLNLTDEPYLELVKDLPSSPRRISIHSPSEELERIEGYWDEPVSYELAS